MKTFHFPAVELPPYAEPVEQSALEVGKVYFWINYFDHDMLIPDFWPAVLTARDEDGTTYFQDVPSYDSGIRLDTATEENARIEACEAGSTHHIFNADKAIEELMKWFLRWRENEA